MASPELPPVRPAVRALTSQLIADRRHLHQHPELSWQEHETQRYLLQRLSELGLADVRPIARTGATALVEGARPGPCVLWRADIDALPVPEKSGLPFASVNEGVMHACGHDTHMAIALGLAAWAQQHRADLPGAIRFVFQPAEEAAGGAAACIADGVLENPRVDVALGLHISADIPIGAINLAPGPFFAAPTALRIEITGRGGHAAAPHQAVDAIVVAAHAVTALQTVVSRSLPPSEQAVLTIGKIQGGFRGNVIAESAVMSGTIRSYSAAVRDLMLRRTEEILAGVCAAFGATFELRHETSCPPLVNDPAVTAEVLELARAYFGPGRVIGVPTMGAEDMSVFLEARPGCYFWLGARNERKGIAGRHHDPGFVIDEDALPLGVEFAARMVEHFLRR
ncbi:M20 family metallopeptidase [Tepidiforma sp.]|jgi:amidohydrolase|uniref:M20 metallopeptidase family protein n=1 Tax=Tepidiforma sp. TaxID=2682230 RepID=UPI0021DD65CF|nr:amidohydrolase [Tepidiforma sp.]MCX7617328.1 amidohydrolase [Tepidiforma sp.]GIW18606.1 MAG: peptidase M20 [Tepidiforma sp.]